jgi:deoxyadenosine/deoxycytidine kinase
MSSLLRPPDLIVYLRANVPTLLERIASRGREYEQGISADYLAELNALYDEWAAGFMASPVLTLDTDDVNVLTDDGGVNRMVASIEQALSSPR